MDINNQNEENVEMESDHPVAGKILLWIFFLLIAGSVGATFYRIVIKKNYVIEMQIECDPTIEQCFIYRCDPAAEECTGNEDEDTAYYKILKKNASEIPPTENDPNNLSCAPGEKDCEELLCFDETKTAEQECSDPEAYNAAHPATEEEDGTACDSENPEDCASTGQENADSSDAPADETQDSSQNGNTSVE